MLLHFQDAAERTPTRDTSIERVVQNALTQHSIRFVTQYTIGRYICDIYLPERRTVIEVQGCYWHGCEVCGFRYPVKKRRDARKLGYLKYRGYRVVLLWEHDILAGHTEALLHQYRVLPLTRKGGA